MDSQENVLQNEEQLEEKKVEETVVNDTLAKVEEAVEEPATETAEQEPETDNVESMESLPQETSEADNQPVAEVENPDVEEEQPAEIAAEEEQSEEPADTVEEKPTEEQKIYKTKAEVIERIKELAHGEESPTKEEVDLLKTIFYKLHFAEREADMKAYLDNGGDPEKYQVLPDEDENVFKAEMSLIKEKRSKLFQEQETEKQENLKRKLEIIEQIKTMVTSPEEANKNYQEFKKLQQEWKEIKLIPAEKANELWRN